jgi:hypothetical protein
LRVFPFFGCLGIAFWLKGSVAIIFYRDKSLLFI